MLGYFVVHCGLITGGGPVRSSLTIHTELTLAHTRHFLSGWQRLGAWILHVICGSLCKVRSTVWFTPYNKIGGFFYMYLHVKRIKEFTGYLQSRVLYTCTFFGHDSRYSLWSKLLIWKYSSFAFCLFFIFMILICCLCLCWQFPGFREQSFNHAPNKRQKKGWFIHCSRSRVTEVVLMYLKPKQYGCNFLLDIVSTSQ